MRIRILTNAAALAEVAADEIAGWLTRHVDRTIGLAGGSTPRLTYELLADRTVPWEAVHAWMTDERHVPENHPESNAGMARRALFDHVPATLHAVPHDENPQVAAADYEETLRRLLGGTRGGGPQPGLVVLGVGEDGHTASLFPGSAALEDNERDFMANWVTDKASWRLTATLPLLARARRTLFLVSGEHKAGVVAEILERSADLPAAAVHRLARDSVWLLDRAAASALSQAGT